MIESAKNINVLKAQDTTKYIPEEFKKVAQGMESQFLEYMLKKMNDTVTKSGTESTAEGYYKSLQTSERAKTMSQLSREGSLKNLILDKIYPQKFRNEQAYNAYLNSKKQVSNRNTIEIKDSAKGI